MKTATRAPWSINAPSPETVRARARRLVLAAAAGITSSKALVTAMRADARGAFERLAMDLLDQSVVPATERGLTDTEVDAAVIAEIAYLALTAELKHLERTLKEKPEKFRRRRLK